MESPILALKGTTTKSTSAMHLTADDAAVEWGKRYLPPRQGSLKCEIVNSYVEKAFFKSINSVDNRYAKEVAEQSGEVRVTFE